MDERKQYPVIGSVTISTEEYRDLIEERAVAIKTTEEYRSKFWAEEVKTKKFESEKVILEDKLLQYEGFLAKKGLLSDFKIWRFEMVEEADAQ